MAKILLAGLTTYWNRSHSRRAKPALSMGCEKAVWQDASIHLGSAAWLGHPILVLCPTKHHNQDLRRSLPRRKPPHPSLSRFLKHFIIFRCVSLAGERWH